MGFAMPNPSHALLINLLGVGNDPIQGLVFGREAIDTALVARVISDDDVPTGSPLVLEGQHDRFFFGRCHAGHYARCPLRIPGHLMPGFG